MRPVHTSKNVTVLKVHLTTLWSPSNQNLTVQVKILCTVYSATSAIIYIYIGCTSRTLQERFSEHKSSVRTFKNNTIGEHFNGPGHSVANLTICAFEKVLSVSQEILEKRESFYINKLESEHKGLNKKKLK